MTSVDAFRRGAAGSTLFPGLSYVCECMRGRGGGRRKKQKKNAAAVIRIIRFTAGHLRFARSVASTAWTLPMKKRSCRVFQSTEIFALLLRAPFIPFYPCPETCTTLASSSGNVRWNFIGTSRPGNRAKRIFLASGCTR